MTFGEKLRNLRMGEKIKQEDLAGLLKVSKATISKYESDLIQPDLEMIKKIAEYFGVSADYLLGVRNKSAFPKCRITAFMEYRESKEHFCKRFDISEDYFDDLESGDALIDEELANKLAESQNVDVRFVYGLDFETEKPYSSIPLGMKNDYLDNQPDPSKRDLFLFQYLNGKFSDEQKIPLADSLKLTVSREERDNLLRVRNSGRWPSPFELSLISAYRNQDDSVKAGIRSILHLPADEAKEDDNLDSIYNDMGSEITPDLKLNPISSSNTK